MRLLAAREFPKRFKVSVVCLFQSIQICFLHNTWVTQVHLSPRAGLDCPRGSAQANSRKAPKIQRFLLRERLTAACG